jgi:predicted acetyltransferase
MHRDETQRGLYGGWTGNLVEGGRSTVDISIAPVPIEQKPVIRNMLELYIHDLSEFAGFDLGETGLYGYRWLDHYWTEPDRSPFLIRVNGRLAGFALINQIPRHGQLESRIAEFFILRKYRQQGIGEFVARDLFARYPGPWYVEELRDNEPAQRFWRSVIGQVTHGDFRERIDHDRQRVIQEFRIGVDQAREILPPDTGPG